MKMETTVIENSADWQRVRFAWNDLVRDSYDDFNPFVSFEWLFAWWAVFGKGKLLRIILVREDNLLVAIAPLMISRQMGFRVCEFLGTGRSDYPGFIVVKNSQDQVLEHILATVKQRLAWDLVNLRDYNQDPCRIQRLCRRHGLRGTAVVGDISPYIALEGTWDDYLAGKSRKHRGNIRRLIKDVEKDGRICLECLTDYRPKLVDELAALEKQSWKAQTGELRMSGPGKAFYQKFLSAFARKGWLEVWTLRYNHRLLAYNINFVAGKSYYVYNVCFDRNSKKYTKHSVGSAITAFAVRSAFERGHCVYDFLRGDEPYKRLWSNRENQLHYLALYKRQPLSFMAFHLHHHLRLRLRANQTAMKVFSIYKQRRASG